MACEGLRTIPLEKRGYQPSSISSNLPPLPELQVVHRDVLLRRPPVPPSASLTLHTSLVETIFQRLARTECVTGLAPTGLNGAGKTMLAALAYYDAKHGLFSHLLLWLDIGFTVTLIDIVGSPGKAMGRCCHPH
jgi:hypothetical protein